ncbi:MAG: MvaI/BcnI restriction endonuclease family protein, partial [Verrucomicrobia bacterium]|nr:MvaI/BcnI restriction endonuclease family protein [Verrucomicrobiota bacterium]
ALACGAVYYDPGIKLEQASSAKPAAKKRSQFRVASKHIAALYETVEVVEV